MREQAQFELAVFSFDAYKQIHDERGWLERKVVALPAALFHLVVAVTKAAYALFITMFGDFHRVKVAFFEVAREEQEAWGRLATVGSDVYGYFHLFDSRVHKDKGDHSVTSAITQ